MLSICMTTNARAQADFVITLGEQIEIISASGVSPSLFPASNVLDDDLTYASRFTTRANPNDLFLDLGDIWTVDFLQIAWGLGHIRAYEFEIATRANEIEDWTTVFEGNSSGTTEEFEVHNVTPSNAKFIRIRGLSNSVGSNATHITEVQAFGREVPVGTPDAPNVLLGFLNGQTHHVGHETGYDQVQYEGSPENYTIVATEVAGTYHVLKPDGGFDVLVDIESLLFQETDQQFDIESLVKPILVTPPENMTVLEHFGEPITLVGANIPWSTDSGFSSDFGWYSPLNIAAYRDRFSQLQDVGANSARVWLHTTSQVTPDIAENGVVTGLSHISSNDVVIDQLRNVLDEAWERGIVVTYSLFSYNMFCDFYGNDYGYSGVEQMERHRMMIEDNYESYIENALLPIVNGLKDHPGLFAYEVFNEPEGAIVDMTDAGHFCPDVANVPGDGLTYPPSLEGIQRFVNRIAAAVHEADPNVKMTTSTHTDFFDAFSNQTLLSQPGADQSGTLDFYELHFYRFYENPPYTTNADVYNSDRPILIGEYSTGEVQQESLFQVTPQDSIFQIINQGYAGAWPWSLLDNQFGDIELAISNVPSINKTIDRDAVEACIQSRDSTCYK